MIIGVDFDNTIVSYDALFHRLAVERRWVEPETPATKTAVRDALRAAGRENDWTWLQGMAYGSRIVDARGFDGAFQFFERCRELGARACIISHKTRHPFLGEQVDLHKAARGWLVAHGFLEVLPSNAAFFEPTKEEKLARIAKQGCTHFIDDLPEFLDEPAFPAGVHRLLFDPSGEKAHGPGIASYPSWHSIQQAILKPAEQLQR